MFIKMNREGRIRENVLQLVSFVIYLFLKVEAVNEINDHAHILGRRILLQTCVIIAF